MNLTLIHTLSPSGFDDIFLLEFEIDSEHA